MHLFMCSIMVVLCCRMPNYQLQQKCSKIQDGSRKKHTECKLSSYRTHAAECNYSRFCMHAVECGLNSTCRCYKRKADSIMQDACFRAHVQQGQNMNFRMQVQQLQHGSSRVQVVEWCDPYSTVQAQQLQHVSPRAQSPQWQNGCSIMPEQQLLMLTLDTHSQVAEHVFGVQAQQV